MGDLIAMPHKDVTATLEILDRFGVKPEHLKKFRGGSSWFQQQFATALISGEESFFTKLGKDKDPDDPKEDALRWIKLDENMIAVNLGFSPKLPFEGAKIESHIGEGWVIVEKRGKWLYIDGRKVVLFLSKRQKGRGYLRGHELREELTGKLVLNANVLDALYENAHLIPEDWKKDSAGNTRYVYFWGTRYSDRDGNECVRCLYFDGDAWDRGCGWLGRGWRSGESAAVLAGPSVLVP